MPSCRENVFGEGSHDYGLCRCAVEQMSRRYDLNIASGIIHTTKEYEATDVDYRSAP